MRIEGEESRVPVARLRDVRVTAGALTAALQLGDQEWRLVLEAGEISTLHAAIHEWFKAQQPGREGPGRSEG
ncbi:MAG TPA: hypothetical protein VGT06_01030 [Candidatus Methylomirabilis sp.]|jgi:hypothetical protein|nr:hypothetical protein [Candidatus Methylomirabilis sp.]